MVLQLAFAGLLGAFWALDLLIAWILILLYLGLCALIPMLAHTMPHHVAIALILSIACVLPTLDIESPPDSLLVLFLTDEALWLLGF